MLNYELEKDDWM